MKTLVKTGKMSREEWLEWRKKGIGASDASIICGSNPWKTPFELWMEKTEQAAPPEAGEAAYWGNVLEEIVAQEFAKRTGFTIKRKNVILHNPKLDYPCFTTPDREIIFPDGKKGLLECKTTSAYKKEEWEDDGLPDYYYAQVQHQYLTTEAPRIFVAVLIGGNEFNYLEIPRDEDFIKTLIEKERDFWHKVQNNIRPALTGKEGGFIKTLYPNSNGTKIALSEEAIPIITEYEKAKIAEQEIKEKKNRLENELKLLLGENEQGVIQSNLAEYKISWKKLEAERLNTNKLKKEMPDVFARYVAKNEYRRFSIAASF